MRKIYLSPHLDDAVLSCGGIIFEERKAGIAVEIWNWMSGIPAPDASLSDLACSVHAEWGLASATAKEAIGRRLDEDRLATARVDALPRYFNFLDCIYRSDEDGNMLYTKEVFASPHPADASLVRKIAKVITENLQPDDVLISPLTIGAHPDHVIVRRAAEKTGHPLSYYVDIPYILWHSEQLAEITQKMQGELHQVSEEGLRVWQDAVSAYASQMDILFEGEEMMRKALKLNWRAFPSVQIFSKF